MPTPPLSDLVTDVVVFSVLKWSTSQDKDHRYGHGKVETLLASYAEWSYLAGTDFV